MNSHRPSTRFEFKQKAVKLHEKLGATHAEMVHAQTERLIDVESYDGFRPPRWCHSSIFQSLGRSEALPATPALSGRGARPGSFLSVVRGGGCNAPRALFRAGGCLEASGQRPLGACPYRRQCAECLPLKFNGGLSQTVMG